MRPLCQLGLATGLLLCGASCNKPSAVGKLGAAQAESKDVSSVRSASVSQARVIMSPEHLHTNIKARALTVRVAIPDSKLTEEVANDLIASMTLATWPEQRALAFHVKASRDPDPWRAPHIVDFELEPAHALADGWYTLSLGADPGTKVAGVPEVVSRFRVGSEPGIRRVRVCDTPGAGRGFDIIASLSEPIDPANFEHSRVSDAGSRLAQGCKPVLPARRIPSDLILQASDVEHHLPAASSNRGEAAEPGLHELRYHCDADYDGAELTLESPALRTLRRTSLAKHSLRLQAGQRLNREGQCRTVDLPDFVALEEERP